MTAPTRRRRRRIQVPEEIEEEVEEIEEEEIEEEEEEEEVPAPAARRRKAVKVVVEHEEEEEEEEPVVVKRSKAPTAKKAAKVEEAVTTADPIGYLLSELAKGSIILIKALGDGEYHLQLSATSGIVTVGPQKLTGKAYWDEVLSQEFKEHDEEWKQLSYKEKLAAAKKLKATWESHEDERVDVMRITESVRNKLGISKYKPEYEDRSTRAAIRG